LSSFTLERKSYLNFFQLDHLNFKQFSFEQSIFNGLTKKENLSFESEQKGICRKEKVFLFKIQNITIRRLEQKIRIILFVPLLSLCV
jgi:hypothetical protein